MELPNNIKSTYHYQWLPCVVNSSVVAGHRFYADPDPNFHSDVDPDPEWHHNNADLYTDFTHVGK
jgi:hypothetical protein